jgi:hypothetical protein
VPVTQAPLPEWKEVKKGDLNQPIPSTQITLTPSQFKNLGITLRQGVDTVNYYRKLWSSIKPLILKRCEVSMPSIFDNANKAGLNPMLTKWCHKCRNKKPKDEFRPHPNSKDGLQIYCKLCQAKANQKRYYENQKEKIQQTIENRTINRELLSNYAQNHPCHRCQTITENPTITHPSFFKPLSRLTSTPKKIQEYLENAVVTCKPCRRLELKEKRQRKPKTLSVTVG